jgi:hypothetical protein
MARGKKHGAEQVMNLLRKIEGTTVCRSKPGGEVYAVARLAYACWLLLRPKYDTL